MVSTDDFHFRAVLLAQDDGAPNLGGGAPTNGATTPAGATPSTGPGGPGGGGPGGGGGAGGADFIWLIFLLFLAVIVWSFIGQRRERKKREAMLSAIRKHDRVQTIGGVIGSVVDIKPDTVILKVDESSNTRMTFARSAIQQVLTERSEEEKEAVESAE